MSKLVQGCVAELVGTFVFVFIGIGSIILAQPFAGGAGTLGTIALAHGLALSVMVTATMYISGGQLNPGVSLGLCVIGKQSGRQAGAFIGAQLLGATCAAGLWQLLLGPAVADSEAVKLGATIGRLTSGADASALGVLGIEIILTFALMTAILMGTVDERAHKLGGFVIGLTVTACILVAGPLTGASMNPARTFGPAVCGRHWDMHWAYWIAPIIGATGAALLYRQVWTKKAK